MKKLSVLSGLVITLSACGKSAPTPTVEAISAVREDTLYSSHQSKIIGDNNLIKVKKDGSNVDSNLRGYLDAFGIISLGDAGVCSGTHIGKGYVITAGHCILPQGTEGVLTNKDCSSIKVYWGYRGSPETGSPKPLITLASQCTQVVYAELTKERDFAIFKIDQAPKVSLPIASSGKRAAGGTKLTIFGYPQGRPLEWSQYCKLYTIDSIPTNFAHQCDTEPGNSGSTVLAINSSGKPMVVGIHDSGLEKDEYNLATHLADALQAAKDKTGLSLVSSAKDPIADTSPGGL